MPICDIRIVDPESKRPLQGGQSGLLLVKGPQVMKCYYNDEGTSRYSNRTNMPVATREAVDSDGWLDTGDAGYIDGEGFLYIKDRSEHA